MSIVIDTPVWELLLARGTYTLERAGICARSIRKYGESVQMKMSSRWAAIGAGVMMAAVAVAIIVVIGSRGKQMSFLSSRPAAPAAKTASGLFPVAGAPQPVGKTLLASFAAG